MLRASGLVILALAICLAVISVPPRLEQIAAVCAAPPCVQGQLSPEGARTAEDHGLSLGSYAGLTTALDVAAVATYLAVALVLFWRKGTERMAFFVALLWVGLGLDTFPLGTLAAEWPAWDRAVAVNYSLSIGVLLVAFAALFPDGRFVPRWMRWAVAVAAAEEFVRLAFPSSPLSPSSRPEELQLLENAGWIVLMVGAQVYRYRRVSGPVQRQQTKWVVFAFAFALGLNVAVGLLPLIAPVAGQEGSPAALALAAAVDASLILTPLAVGVAILRHRLFDVDLLINRALVYGGLSASLALVYVASVVSLQAVFAA